MFGPNKRSWLPRNKEHEGNNKYDLHAENAPRHFGDGLPLVLLREVVESSLRVGDVVGYLQVAGTTDHKDGQGDWACNSSEDECTRRPHVGLEYLLQVYQIPLLSEEHQVQNQASKF